MADENKPTNTTEIEDGDIQTNWDECTTTFDSMDLKEDLLRGIYAYGFEKPSAIQQVRLRNVGGRFIDGSANHCSLFSSLHSARSSPCSLART